MKIEVMEEVENEEGKGGIGEDEGSRKWRKRWCRRR